MYTRLAASARVRLGEGVVPVRSAGRGARRCARRRTRRRRIRARPARADRFARRASRRVARRSRVCRRSRAPPKCSASIWRASTCARAPTSTKRVIAELLARAGVEADYAALPEEDKLDVLLAELAQPRPLRLPYADYSDLAKSELGVLEAARDHAREVRRARGAQLHHLAHGDRERSAGSDAAAKGNRLAAAARLGDANDPARSRPDGDPAVRDHSRLAQRAAHHARV